MTLPASLRLLRVMCLLTIVVGLVAAAASAEATEGVWLKLFDLLAWPIDGDPARFTNAGRSLNAVLGGLMVGWAVLMYGIVVGPFQRGDYSLVNPMIWALLAWFVVDSAASVVSGLPGNVLFNISFLVLFLIPLRALRGPQG